MRVHLVDDRKLQDGVKDAKRPERIEVARLCPVDRYEIERNRPNEIREDERSKDREPPETPPYQEHQEKCCVLPEANRPEQKIETSQMHLGSPHERPSSGIMHWILRQTEERKNQTHDVRFDRLRFASGNSGRSRGRGCGGRRGRGGSRSRT